MTGTTARHVIRDYLLHAPEQSDWPDEDHANGLALGVLGALEEAGYMVARRSMEKLWRGLYEASDAAHLQLVRAVRQVLDDQGIPPYNPDVALIDRMDQL